MPYRNHHKNFTNVSGFALVAVILVALIVMLMIRNAVASHQGTRAIAAQTAASPPVISAPLSHADYENIVESNDQLRNLAAQLEAMNDKLATLTKLNTRLLETGNHLTGVGFEEKIQKAVDRRLQQIKNNRYGKHKTKYCSGKHKKKNAKCNKRHRKGKR